MDWKANPNATEVNLESEGLPNSQFKLAGRACQMFDIGKRMNSVMGPDKPERIAGASPTAPQLTHTQAKIAKEKSGKIPK